MILSTVLEDYTVALLFPKDQMAWLKISNDVFSTNDTLLRQGDRYLTYGNEEQGICDEHEGHNYVHLYKKIRNLKHKARGKNVTL